MSELSTLFDLDPLKMSDQDLQAIIARMREAQAQFELGIKAPVAARPKKVKGTGAADDMLKELGLK